MAEKFEYEGWAILELFGHRRLGGKVTIAELGGAQLLRLDIHEKQPCIKGCAGERSRMPHPEEDYAVDCPGSKDSVTATQFYGGGALYCLTPCDEAAARAVAAANKPAPVQEWELPRPRIGWDRHDVGADRPSAGL
jgi:endonuclease I